MLRQYDDDPWVYRVYLFEDFIANTQSRPFRQFLADIKYPHSANAVDDWADYDFADFKGYHSRIGLLGVLNDPFDVEYRIWGGGLSDIYQEDLTGRTLRSLGSGRFEVELDYLQDLIATRGIGYGEGPIYWQNRDYQTIRYIDIPLRNDSEDIRRILTFYEMPE